MKRKEVAFEQNQVTMYLTEMQEATRAEKKKKSSSSSSYGGNGGNIIYYETCYEATVEYNKKRY